MRHCYAWKSLDSPLTIRIDLSVVRQLGLEALTAKKTVPRRGLEIGGILLGRRDSRQNHTVLTIESYAPLASEYRSGPSFALSENDKTALNELLRKHRDIIGVFRSQTREPTLLPCEGDEAFYSRCVEQRPGLLMLMSPEPMQAGYFLFKDGALHCAHVFPFRTSSLPVEDLEVNREAPEENTGPAGHEVIQTEPTRALAPARSGGLIRRTWAVVAAAALLALLLVMFKGGPGGSHRTPVPANVRLGLDISQQGPALTVRWNPASETARTASSATLRITDGSILKEIPLTPRDIAAGTMSYSPQSTEIRLQLEVHSPGRSSIETVHFIAERPAIAVTKPPEPAQPLRAERPPARSEPKHLPNRTVVPRPHAGASRVFEPDTKPPSGYADRVMEKAPAPVVPDPVSTDRLPVSPRAIEPPPPQAPPRKNEPIAAPAWSEPTPIAARRLEPYVAVTSEPAGGPRLAKVPLLNFFRRDKPDYIPPEPVLEVKPTLSAREYGAVTRVISVDVRVYITDSGSVEFAEATSGAGHRDLAAAAVYAARKWKFSPARLGSEKVTGEAVLHFVFVPPSGTRP